MFEPFLRSGDRAADDHAFLQSLSALLGPASHSIASQYAGLANAAALLWWYLTDINWAGFYLTNFEIPVIRKASDLDSMFPIGTLLQLGPFQGVPACISIPFGRGVCGTAAATGKPQLVADVHAFPDYIACDGDSRSELVVPIFKEGVMVGGDQASKAVAGVIDIDSPLVGRFTDTDVRFIEEVARVVGERLF
ncbi:MAG: GAF domain-containing protein [Sphaerochaetaceae bacterium]|nr:GAF domain-containing protein [Sphaerochaetaceae bacterium]